jgi:hypothetical protein
VLPIFADKLSEARKQYLAYVKAGINQGRRPDLVGGGLLRSLGGWAEVKRQRHQVQHELKSDTRILGDINFVIAVLAKVEEKVNHHYDLKCRGYDFKTVEQKVMEIFDIDKNVIYVKGRRRKEVQARCLLCYWAVRELGMRCTDLIQRLNMTQPAVGYAVDRGEKIAKDMNFSLTK